MNWQEICSQWHWQGIVEVNSMTFLTTFCTLCTVKCVNELSFKRMPAILQFSYKCNACLVSC
jgi:hypothetical protein